MKADESAEGIKRMYGRKLKDHLCSNYCKKYTSAISRKLRFPMKFSTSFTHSRMRWIWQHWFWLRSLLCCLSLHFYKSPVSNNPASLGFCFLLEKVSSGDSSMHALKLSCSKYRSSSDSVCFSISSLFALFPSEVLEWELYCHQLQYCLLLCQRVHLDF